ncbi:sulfotransferase [Stieleria varia]|uniref:Sulfotransferase domain protein n=1 Tax=Stieleria varia TaxID=2528005 RepID=A0A5C6B289_9BACT|nr:sulfotransferase [Stieleria varia]TWU05957.1 hypothetical protein Pla52n_16730 [Stieleria varia]
MMTQILSAWKQFPRQHAQLRGFPSGPPIFIGGTHRSGTTWFASMMAEPGLWYIHEPFNPNKNIWSQGFTYASPSCKRSDIDSYVAAILDGRFRITSITPNTHHRLMPLRLFRPPIRRTMIKDPLACLLTGYLAEHFDFQTLALFRHPAGFVSSILRLGWPIGDLIKDFLSRQDLIEDHLHPHVDLMETHQNGNDAAAATVLHGVLNLVQWNQLQQNPRIVHYLFEELCEHPIESFQTIFHEVGLPYTEETRERHTRLCMNGSIDPGDYHTHAVNRNSAAMADSWKRQLSGEQILQVQRVWDRFDVPLYREPHWWSTMPSTERV